MAPILNKAPKLRLHADGSVLVTAGTGMVALDQAGAPVPGFSYAGPSEPDAFELLNDGRIVTGAGISIGKVVVLEANGTPDPDVGTDPDSPGVVNIDVSPQPEGVTELDGAAVWGLRRDRRL